MDIPLGYEKESWANKVCKLKKSLYSLKQSPWAWFGRFMKAMVRRGYHQSQSDHTLFIKHAHLGKITTLIVYVDDIVVTGDDQEEILGLKSYLTK